jgi:glycosyltransferase involved in cell wall biosynthesis
MSQQVGEWRLAHLTASPFYGGPERQMVGLASAMPATCRSSFICLMEGGKARPFIEQLRQRGQEALPIQKNYPNLIGTIREVTRTLQQMHADVLLTHGYKANIIGLPAARLAGIPVVMVSRGWTSATLKVRLYEVIDRMALRMADRVVCVSEGQAQKVRKARVDARKLLVIRNAIHVSRFERTEPCMAGRLGSLLGEPVRKVVVAVGRLSPEKGFGQLIEAAAKVGATCKDVGFVLIGEGPLRGELQQQIDARGIGKRFVLAGFREDIDALLPHATCLVQSSYTEGMPNVVLEAMAAALPVVATAVGGTPELVVGGKTGILVPPGNADALAGGLMSLLADANRGLEMGRAGRMRVEEHFTFASQAAAYLRLIESVLRAGTAAGEPMGQAVGA